MRWMPFDRDDPRRSYVRHPAILMEYVEGATMANFPSPKGSDQFLAPSCNDDWMLLSQKVLIIFHILLV